VYAVVRRLATRAHMPMPRLYVMPGSQPNAFATGRGPRHAAIAANEGLLIGLSLEQIEAALAHEIAHVKNHDILVSPLAAMIVVPLGATLLRLGVSPGREYLADATAAQLLGTGAPLADALETIAGTHALPRRSSTHPPIAQRIRRLRAYDGQIVRGEVPARRRRGAVSGPWLATRS
jgi:heat shock protein HtpX